MGLAAMGAAEGRAVVIADSRLAENAGWDRALLGLELQYLTELEIDFDVTVTPDKCLELCWGQQFWRGPRRSHPPSDSKTGRDGSGRHPRLLAPPGDRA